MAKVQYLRPGDNVAAAATITVETGTADDGYPADNLVDLNPGKPARLVETSGAWLFDFGAAQSLDLVALIHHNLDAGLDVRIQGNDTDDWTTPALDEAITIPAAAADGYPVCPFLDLTAITPRSYQFWRLVVVDANAAPVAIGEVILGETIRELTVNVNWGARESEDRLIIEHTTDMGVSTIYDLGVRQRVFEGDVDTTDAGAAELRDLVRAARARVDPWLFIPDPDVNDAWFVRFADAKALRRTMVFIDSNQLPFVVEEVSRGLVL